MRRLFLGFLSLLATHTTVGAFPLRLPPLVSDGAAATWQSQGSGIKAVWYSEPGELIIVAGSEIKRWKHLLPFRERLEGCIPDDCTAIVPIGDSVRLLTKSTLESWKYRDGKWMPEIAESMKHSGSARVALSSQNARTVFWSPGGNVVFQASESAKPITLQLEGVMPAGVALSANGRMLAIASAAGSVQVCNLKPDGTLDRKTSKRFSRRDEIPLTFSSDGRLLAVANGGRLVLLDVNTAQIFRAFERRFDDGDISTMAFSPDGTMVAFGTREPTPVVRVWHLGTGKTLGEFSGHRVAVTSLAFDAKSFQLASGDSAGRVFVWNLARQTDPRQSLTSQDAWEQLDSTYPVTGQHAMSDILGHDATGRTTNLQSLLTRIAEMDKERDLLRKAIVDLDHDEFRVREAARKKVLKTGYRGMELLQEPSRKKLGAEGEERVRSILATFERDGLHKPENEMYGDTLRLLRAIQVLESTNSREVRAVLKELKTRFPGTRIALDAEAILGLNSAPGD